MHICNSLVLGRAFLKLWTLLPAELQDCCVGQLCYRSIRKTNLQGRIYESKFVPEFGPRMVWLCGYEGLGLTAVQEMGCGGSPSSIW